ncbi:DUF2243 domain-containing protein [Streptomyces monticola]|uniref:DUF2243 domain-containing protein n=1 Tax=Streptomyces monticola TaxID=2666263 RepID=A0ABW2JTU0_9ACTN
MTRRSLLGGALVGIGLAAFVDEVVFHQLLHWHHFYDKASSAAGLVSDGIFHAFGWAAMVTGLFVYADLRRRDARSPRAWWAGTCLGVGGFQLYDGTFQHKALGLHQIRYGVDLTPYDLTWNVIAVLFLLTGAVLLLRIRRARAGTRAAGAKSRAAGAKSREAGAKSREAGARNREAGAGTRQP